MIACHTLGIMHTYEEGEIEHINGPTHAHSSNTLESLSKRPEV